MLDTTYPWLSSTTASELADTRWKDAWTNHLAPQMPRQGLLALRDALVSNDPALIQRVTGLCDGGENSPPTAACVIGYCGWKGLDLATAREVGDYFASVLAGPASYQGWLFLRGYDALPREQMLREMLVLVDGELKRREDKPCIA